jgi:hypothetical protein
MGRFIGLGLQPEHIHLTPHPIPPSQHGES